VISTRGTDYLDEAFDQMTINPLNVPKGVYVFEYFEALKRKKVFQVLPEGYDQWTLEDLHTILCFVIFLVDPESPLAGESDMKYRIEQCLLLCSQKKGSLVREEVVSQGLLYRKLVYEYFRYVNEYDYETWWTLKLAFHNDSEFLRRPLSSDDIEASKINARRALQDGLADRQKEIVQLQNRLFPTKRLERMIVEAAQEEEPGGWAEEFAEVNPFLPSSNSDDEVYPQA
jgi:hypothetical protein